MRPIRAKIDLGALRGNLGLARKHAGDARIWAIVKADAYGHGLARVQSALGEADGLALLELDAAITARERGWSKPILLLEGFFEATEIDLFDRHRLTAVIHHHEQIGMLESARLSAPLDVYLKINSGMNRLGFAVSAARAAIERLRASGKISAMTLMTHYADADGERGVAEQAAQFQSVVQSLGLPSSSANSAALLRHPQTRGDWVRPGIVLYGCSPFPEQSAQSIGIRPVMSLTSRIIAVQSVEHGARVGYSGTFIAPRAMRVGVVACGYADGYPRHAPYGTPILVDGVRVHTIGRVSMDMLFVDLSEIPNTGVGSVVTLWGDGLSADEVAASAGTVSYELACGLAARVPVTVVD
ncbi:MAG: alanine racemase [Betaproteobacteria bacterium]|nr:alanine racemase [Betaproteobacteria bacterium]